METLARTDTAVEIDRFLGINDGGGEAGEALAMSNFEITKDGKLRKRKGVGCLSTNGVTGRVIAFSDFYTSTLANYSFFVLTSDALWGYRFQTRAFAPVYTRTTSGPGVLFEKNDRLYLLGTGEYVSFDRTLSTEPVAPYVPTVTIGKNPAGTEYTPFEKPNRLTSYVREEFITGDAATVYKMKYKNISDVSVTGISPLPTYTVNSAGGSITFAYTPAPGGKLVVTYSSAELAGRDTAVKNAVGGIFFGGTGDGDLFVWNGEDNVRYYTERGDVSYFPEDDSDTVGNGKILDAVRLYGTMLCFTTDGIYSSVADVTSDGDVAYPTALINADCRYLSSNVATADNLPVFMSSSKLKRVVSTAVLGEKNVETVSDRVEKTLKSLTTGGIYTVASRGEVWITATGTTVVWNYVKNLFYRFDGFTAAFVFELANGVRFIDASGRLCAFTDDTYDTDENGESAAVSACCYLAGLDFGSPFSVKRLNDVYVECEKEETAGGEAAVITGGAGDAAVSVISGGVTRVKQSGERFTSIDLLIRSTGLNESLTVKRAAVAATRLRSVKRA